MYATTVNRESLHHQQCIIRILHILSTSWTNGTKVPGPFRFWKRKFQGANWPGFYWPIRSRERMGLGAKRLWIGHTKRRRQRRCHPVVCPVVLVGVIFRLYGRKSCIYTLFSVHTDGNLQLNCAIFHPYGRKIANYYSWFPSNQV